MQNHVIKPSKLSGQINAPPSKSHSQRAILFASMANGQSHLDNILISPDINAMANACRQLGATINYQDNKIIVDGVNAKPHRPEQIIDAGNSGQVLRFISAIAALMPGPTTITGDASIQNNRPIQPLTHALGQLGATCRTPIRINHPPVTIHGPISPGETSLNGEDSQPVSAMIIAASLLDGITTIKVNNPGEKPWIDLSLSWLKRLDVPYTNSDYQYYTINGKGQIPAFNYTAPGDWSSIAFPLVTAIITQSRITIDHADLNDPQGDKIIIDILRQMGANISVNSDKNTLTTQPSPSLKGLTIDVNACIDALPILTVAACFATTPTQLTNAAIAQQKESNRIDAISSELKKMGAKIETSPDGLTIQPSQLKGANVHSHHDHRIAMALTAAACAAQGPSTIHNSDCVDKSYRDFFQHMRLLGMNAEVICQ